MRLLFLLVFAPLCVAYCPSGHYRDDAFQKCVKCTPCHVVQIPCTKYKDAVCTPVNESEAHHFQKNRIHFFDDTEDDDLDEEMHSKNFVSDFENSYMLLPAEKEPHKKGSKHLKAKHEDKHHHKKKHFEFDSREDFDNYNDDLKISSEENLFSEKPKHKKHYEFNKKHNKKNDDFLTPEEVEDEKLHFILGKESMKAKKKVHHKKINADEETLEEWLKQSQQQLKLRKDDFLKTLKEENGHSFKPPKKVRLNSPIFEADDTGFYDKSIESKPLKNKKFLDRDNLKHLANLRVTDEGIEITPVDDDEDNKIGSPPHSVSSPKPSAHSEIIGQGKVPDEVIRDEMGKHIIFEKPRFNVIPFVIGKDPAEKKPFFSKQHSGSPRKDSNWNNEAIEGTESGVVQEMKTRDVVSLPFTAAETLVWDWQAVAVASAVASCLVFFLVIAIYFIINAGQWKKVSKTYNKEIEEMSTRIALMQPTLESGSSDSHTTSLYMENIVFPGKEDEKKGDQKV